MLLKCKRNDYDEDDIHKDVYMRYNEADENCKTMTIDFNKKIDRDNCKVRPCHDNCLVEMRVKI